MKAASALSEQKAANTCAAATVADDIDTLVRAIVAAARPGDHVVCMSNGGFGGIHARLLAALQARAA